MICLKTFKIKTHSDFNGWDEWVIFVNNNINYAKTKSNVKDFKGKCEPTDLPSFHPYWCFMAKLRKRKYLFQIKTWYKECLIDRSKIKYYFNSSTDIFDIKFKIDKLKREIYFDN